MAALLIDCSKTGPGLAHVGAPLDDYVHVSVVTTDFRVLSSALGKSQQRPLASEQECWDAEAVITFFSCLVHLRVRDVTKALQRRAAARRGEECKCSYYKRCGKRHYYDRFSLNQPRPLVFQCNGRGNKPGMCSVNSGCVLESRDTPTSRCVTW